MAIAWWANAARSQFTKACWNHFDVRLSCKLGKGFPMKAHADETSKKLGKIRSHNVVTSKAGIRRQGFGITERSPHSRGLQSRSK